MNQKVNKNYKDVFLKKPRYIILMGGRGAGRSTVASQFATAKLTAKEYFRCAIMRFVLSDIRNSIFQDILDRIEEAKITDHINIMENKLTMTYGRNKINGIGFRKSSGEQKSKLKSLANYNCVIIEEADEVSEEDFMQLDDSLRTIKSDITIILLLNPPPKNHWIVRRWFNLIDCGIEGFYKAELKSTETDTLYIHTTYRENRANLNQKTIDNFKKYKETRPDHYYNMIEGLVSEGARGRIFKNWKIITDEEYDELPYVPYDGLDFGFTNDPTALIEIKEHNNKLYLKELIYETGLTNPKIAEKAEQKGVSKNAEIIGDCSEPKSIEEIKQQGFTKIVGSVKGADSIRAGIDLLLEKEVYYTESSKNIALEQQEYRWALDRNKEPTNAPIDEFNHAIDAVRGAVFTKHTVKKKLSGFF